jgi:hypothetical protein
MPYTGLKRAFYAYTSDDTNTYQLASSTDNGTVNSASGVAPGTNPTYPRGWVARHVYGVDSSGNRTKVPILNPSDSLFVNGGTFSKAGSSFTVEGKIGEKRMNKGG